MNNQTFTVSIDFIIDALQLRYDNVKELWGCDAAHELWEQALSMVEECGIGDNVTSPYIFVFTIKPMFLIIFLTYKFTID